MTAEEYEKKRKAVLKCTNNDVVRTTEILDKDAEQNLMMQYLQWSTENRLECYGRPKDDGFWKGLQIEVYEDWREDEEAYANLGVRLEKKIGRAHV